MEYKGYEIKIEPDENADSPREWDNLGDMLCFHKRYSLGDKQDSVNSNDFSSWDDVKNYLRKNGGICIAPLYLYDHSGLRIKIGSFYGLLPQGHAEFDSGQVGFIYATKDKIRKEFNVKRVSKKLIDKVYGILESEVKVYDQYLMGDVWGYTIEKDGEHIDSCWGFYGSDECEAEAKSIVDSKA